ncbi:hypothetical protein SAMN05421644_14018 [Allochromatium warmingii]|uniref:Uncharacterized protein n=1 Tax=Allochromatium warmingii TaxID=61595 RepID=A0A1H3I5V5_ALLWA|nr:hypothetical protein SAMN05421644_14018 [Allochromatium warmingii]
MRLNVCIQEPKNGNLSVSSRCGQLADCSLGATITDACRAVVRWLVCGR